MTFRSAGDMAREMEAQELERRKTEALESIATTLKEGLVLLREQGLGGNAASGQEGT